MAEIKYLGPDEIRKLRFASYWPEGAAEIVREFLATTYDPKTMPALILNERDGERWLIGWQAVEGEPNLMEAARGWALTGAEGEWALLVARLDEEGGGDG